MLAEFASRPNSATVYGLGRSWTLADSRPNVVPRKGRRVSVRLVERSYRIFANTSSAARAWSTPPRASAIFFAWISEA